MDYAEFIETVERAAHVDRDAAERAARAVLRTLAERLSGGEAEDIAEQLPPELQEAMHDGPAAEGFGLEEFLQRVAEREDVPEDEAEDHARAVFAALARAVSWDEIEDMASELPKELKALLPDDPPPPPAPSPPYVPSAAEILQRVREATGLDPGSAHRLLEATLEMLAVRISRGQVDDLEKWLPRELWPPLERGSGRSDGAAQPLSLDEFVAGIAELASMTPDEAFEDARAVLSVLREVVPEKEWRDALAQMPLDYLALMRPGS